MQKKRVEDISLNTDYVHIPIGTNFTLVATVTPADATNHTVTWLSKNTAVATVDQNGLVTGVSEGAATIVAQADGKQKSCSLHVHATYRIHTSGSSSQGTVTGAGVYPYNSTAKIRACPKAGYYFKCWTENNIAISTEPVITLAVTSDRSIRADFEKIGKPLNITITADSNTSLHLAWPGVAGATGYEIWRSTSPARDYSLIGTASDPAYADGGLVTNNIYYYKIRAVCAGATNTTYGDLSSVKSARAVPAAPAVTVSPASYNSLWVSWNAVTGATKYEVWRSISPDSGYRRISTTSARKRSYKNTGVKTGTIYYYQVRAYQKLGRSIVYGDFSVPAEGQTALSAVAGIKAANVKAGSVKISWNTVAGKSKYEIWRASSPNEGFVLIGTTAHGSYTNNGLSPGTNYYYMIRAYRTVGRTRVYGDFSTVVAATA